MARFPRISASKTDLNRPNFRTTSLKHTHQISTQSYQNIPFDRLFDHHYTSKNRNSRQTTNQNKKAWFSRIPTIKSNLHCQILEQGVVNIPSKFQVNQSTKDHLIGCSIIVAHVRMEIWISPRSLPFFFCSSLLFSPPVMHKFYTLRDSKNSNSLKVF